MAAPTREAWKAAMYMMAYMRDHKDKGIMFTSEGNIEIGRASCRERV